MNLVNWLDHFRHELRQASRALTKSPGFALIAVMAISLGVGATTAVFCMVDAVLLRSLPYPKPDQLVLIEDRQVHEERERNLATPAQYAAWSNAHHSVASVGAFTDALYNLSLGNGGAERIPTLVASRSLYDVLGIRLAQGRLPEEPRGASPVREVVLSHGLWSRLFGGAHIHGQSVLLGNERFSVVGVLPPGASFPGRRMEALLPLPSEAGDDSPNSHRARYLTVIGRLRPEATLDHARQELSAIAGRLGEQYPDTDRQRTVAVSPLSASLLGNARSGLLVLLAGVGSLLLIACVNVSSLLLARSISRRKEMAVRLALGAGRGDLLRQLLAEAAVLAGAGSALGVGAARLCLSVLLALGPQDLPRLADSAVNARALLFALLCAGGAALAIVAVPAWQLLRRDLGDALQGSARGVAVGSKGTRMRGAMMAAQVALALALSAGAGLLVKSLLHVEGVDPGFRADGAIAMEISLPARYSEPQERITFFRRLLDRIADLPGVEATGITNRLPLSGDNSSRLFNLGAMPDPTSQHAVEMRRITPGYFKAVGMRLIRGRLLDERDTAEAPGAVLVSEAFVRRFLRDEEPLGKQVFVQDGPRPRPWSIVGVVNSVRHEGLAAEPSPEVYVSYYDRTWHNMTLVVRTQSDPLGTVSPIRRALAETDPTIPLVGVKPLREFVSASAAQQRFRAFLLSSFSLLALALASVGIYGVTAYAVSERTVEIGIRMALGARPQDILRFVMLWTMRLAGVGLVLGTLLSLAVAWMTRQVLFGVSPFDPVVHLVAVLMLALVAVVACLVPALRAAGLDPATAQRQ